MSRTVVSVSRITLPIPMATTAIQQPHEAVGEKVFDVLVETAAVACAAEIRDSGDVSLADCSGMVREIVRDHGVYAHVYCIEASGKHSSSDVGSKDEPTLGEELLELAIDAVVEAALESLIEDGTITENQISY